MESECLVGWAGSQNMFGWESTLLDPYLGTQGVRVMNPPPAFGSHCSNVQTLCSRPPLVLKIRGVRAQLCLDPTLTVVFL